MSALPESDRALAARFAGPVLLISLEDVSEPEPISPAVLRRSLVAMQELSSAFNAYMRGQPGSVMGGPVGKCEAAAIWLEAELKRVGVV